VPGHAVVPRFAHLPVRPGAPPGSSWGVFGDDDELGTLNFIRPDDIAAAGRLVARGKVFPLDLGLELPDPPFFGRKPIRHTLFAKYGGTALDDYVDALYLQASTHWDGLRHFADPDHGFYNGAQLEELAARGATRLGVQAWARCGIVARGLLLDVGRMLAEEGTVLDPFEFFPIGADLLERTAERQGDELRPGDVLLVRTGWLEAYLELDHEHRERLAALGRPGAPGLHGDAVPAFLWDNRIAAVAADTPALEATRPGDTSPLPLHVALIARLGMPLGELWRLGPLATDCAADGTYATLLVSAPLGVPGGAGAPANALALK
jgi:kynurenine formamidase